MLKKYKLPIDNSERILKKYYTKGAIGHFNALNLLSVQAIIEASQKTKMPVIIAITEAKASYIGGLKNFVNMVSNILENYSKPISISVHLDHSVSLKNCKEAIKMGFSSVMFDGSKLPIEENFKHLKELCYFAKDYDVSVEGEIGSVGGAEDGVIGEGIFANLKDAKLVSQVPFSFLAAGVGNIHGKYPKNWKTLDFKLIEDLVKISKKNLVLHGASGIPDDQVVKAIKKGVKKINVNSEIWWSFFQQLDKDFQSGKIKSNSNWQDPRFLFKNSYDKMLETIVKKIILFSLKN